jgi:hypothetical protein
MDLADERASDLADRRRARMELKVTVDDLLEQ